MFAAGHCAFGQKSAAQSHLARQGVGVGDIFLFFGLFASSDGRDRHHRLFGYLRIEQVRTLGRQPSAAQSPSGFSDRHPHTMGSWEANNTLYLGAGRKALRAPECLRLTRGGGPVSRWVVPDWLRDAGLSYHRDPARWPEATDLRVVGGGQEFVCDIGEDAQAMARLTRILAAIGS